MQLRAAAIQLAVHGVPLARFDPWSLPNPFLVGRPSESPAPTPESVLKVKKGVLSLSAATFKAPRTTRATEAASGGAFGSRSDDDTLVSCAANAASAWLGPFGSHRTAHLGMPVRSETAWWLRRRAATSAS